MRIVNADLAFPEGPIALSDGSVLVVEMGRGTLTRVTAKGGRQVIATLGGGPNGAAMGPGGRVFVTNNGGSEYTRDDAGGWRPVLPPTNYTGGRIEVVNPDTGRFERLYDRCDGEPLNGPNDLAFDADGNFWFTDYCKMPRNPDDRPCIYWARSDGSEIRRVVPHMVGPNGIGLSPDGKRLYASETQTSRLFAWDITGPGELSKRDWPAIYGAQFLCGSDRPQGFDSLKVTVSGKICIGTLFNGGITEVSPDGGWARHHPLPELFVTNLAFGGADRKTMFVTFGHRGMLVALAWHEAGLQLPFSA
ncbi:MAG: SMP-30/gluconolactonase/LRE family protein [Betaproteobacteria bacterium]|nr:SMP-30/gluconolactonase/LRE family protein [Betaproteobacteria bacterium]